MKKVCFIVTDAVSFNSLCRGQLEFFRDNSRFDVTLICGGSARELARLVERQVGKVVYVNMARQPSPLSDVKSLFFLFFYFIFNRFDLVVYSTPKALLLGGLASVLAFQKKRVAIIRGRAYENFTGLKRKVFLCFDKISLLVSHKVVFISSSLMETYLNEGVLSADKAVLLGSGSSNGVDCKRFYKLQKIKKDVFTILVLGRVCKDKGLYDLAKILNKIGGNSIRFFLVGEVEGAEERVFLESLLKTHSSLSHFPNTPDIMPFFEEADLHLFLSHREGFGNVAIEAARCGVPTYAYDVVGVKDSVKEGVSGKRFPFKDTDAIVEAISVAAKANDFHTWFPEASSWAFSNFEQKKVWGGYMRFYERSM